MTGVRRDVPVTVRDGVRLATDVHGPLDAPRPVLLLRTPYGKSAPDLDPAAFVRRGYVVVVQDTRGCFGSEGEVDFLWPEAEDGYDTCAWLVQQPWCDGRVATVGTSWSGWAQTALAALDPPGLAAMVPVQSGAKALQTSVRHRGTVELRFVAWAFWHAPQNLRVTADLTGPKFSELALPVREGSTQLRHVPAYERWVLELVRHGDEDDRWRHPSVSYLDWADRAAAVPTLLVAGWYDSYTRAGFQLFDAMRGRGAPVHLLVGPWTHGTEALGQPWAGDVAFGPHAAVDARELHLSFLDEHLQGVPQPPRAPVRLFVMGGGPGTRDADGRRQHGGAWRDEQEWPLARTRWTPLHLHGDGSLRAAPGEGSTRWTADPADPVPTIGGNVSSLKDLLPGRGSGRPAWVDPARTVDVVSPGGFDQSPLTGRPDVLVFSTPPLASPVEVTGPVTAVLWVSTDAADTDVTARLVDVHPDGYALNLTDSIVRLRHREGETAVPYVPGEVVRVEVELYPTSNVFAAGHRIRLDVASSSFPRFDVNPGTGEPLGRETATVVQHNTVWHDAVHPSHVVLPVVHGAVEPLPT